MTSDKNLDHMAEMTDEVGTYILFATNCLKLIVISFFSIRLCYDTSNPEDRKKLSRSIPI